MKRKFSDLTIKEEIEFLNNKEENTIAYNRLRRVFLLKEVIYKKIKKS
jgi:hypothetical protein